MSEHPSINVSIRDSELRSFVREQANAFFGGKIATYVVSLIERDRREGTTREEVQAKLVRMAEAEKEEVAA